MALASGWTGFEVETDCLELIQDIKKRETWSCGNRSDSV